MDSGRLAALPLFAALSDREVEVIAGVASELSLAPGQALTTEGEFGHALFVIEEGTADVSIDGATVGSVGPGEVVGEVAVLASGRRTASVVATSPLRAIALFKRDVWRLELDAPQAARRVNEALEKHIGSG